MSGAKTLVAVIGTVGLVGACTFGPDGVCGPQTPAAYCDRAAYEKLVYPKPYGAHWVKEGVTTENRRTDSWGCGAGKSVYDADHVQFSDAQIRAVTLPTDANAAEPRNRLGQTWVACMKSKGYHYEK